ncbi:hypothetical protein MHY30_01555 [Microbacterium sp. ACRRU]|uniref:magnesium chelatase domain-containing protein n=1 Tax=Microbacterium sp. ACRRU TaxID=2918204 RepID=UPI001EF54030|nr:magnesium chelatase domain-containing protein [Microbacterium sp. ACRRU]MCG7416195.1 hypothetical protein [Microbacterium sp. ACRRU]
MEADLSPQTPEFSIIGLPDKALGEAGRRVRNACTNRGVDLPKRRLTSSAPPSGMRSSPRRLGAQSSTHLPSPRGARTRRTTTDDGWGRGSTCVASPLGRLIQQDNRSSAAPGCARARRVRRPPAPTTCERSTIAVRRRHTCTSCRRPRTTT